MADDDQTSPADQPPGLDAVREAIEQAERVPPPPQDEEEFGPFDFDEEPEIEPDDPDRLDLECARELRNDLGNANRLRRRSGADLLHVSEQGWHGWNGKCWDQKRGEVAVHRAAQEAALAIFAEAKVLEQRGPRRGEDPKDFAKRLDAHRKWASASGNSAKLSAMVKEAQPHLQRWPEEMDGDAFLFNCMNGTLRLTKPGPDGDGVALLPHDRAHLVTRCAPVAYDPQAQCPTFRRFLNRILPDLGLQVFLQRWFGYCLTGDTGEQVLCMFYGRGANGKSTLLEAMAFILGDYASTIPFASLLQDDRRRGADATPDLARLVGRRMVTAGEADIGAKFSEASIKLMTGQDKMTVRHLYRGFFDLLPNYKIILAFNSKPAIRGQDEGIWRRIILVHFDQFISKAEKDDRLKFKLQAEAPGILNWMLDGYRLWAEGGLSIPATALEAAAEYRRENDPLGDFLDVAVRPRAGARTSATPLYNNYCAWAKQNAREPISQTLFGKIMSERGYQKSKSSIAQYVDLDMIEDFRDAGPPPPM